MAITAGLSGGAQTFADTAKTLLWSKATHGLSPRAWRFSASGAAVLIEIEGNATGVNVATINLPAGTSWDFVDTQTQIEAIYATSTTSGVITWGPAAL